MSHEHLVKRTIYVAQCSCGEKYELDRDPPRERRCKCGKWVTFEEVSFVGPEVSRG